MRHSCPPSLAQAAQFTGLTRARGSPSTLPAGAKSHATRNSRAAARSGSSCSPLRSGAAGTTNEKKNECQQFLPWLRPLGDESCVAAQSFAVARCSVDNEVEAATVAGVNLRRRCARQPLLRHDPSFRTDSFASDLDPRLLNDETTPGQQAGAWAGEVVVPVCIDLGPTAVSAFRATVQGREGQGQPKAAPHCDVHEVGRKGGGCVRRNCRKPHTSMRTGLSVKDSRWPPRPRCRCAGGGRACRGAPTQSRALPGVDPRRASTTRSPRCRSRGPLERRVPAVPPYPTPASCPTRPTTLARRCSPRLGAPLVECAVGCPAASRRQLRARSMDHAAAAWCARRAPVG